MPTTTVKSIGTSSRDYSTLQSWEDACPSNLVTNDEIWKGECYNDSEFTAGLEMGGVTTDATRYLWLTAAAGHSFMDHANVRTNPLTYDQGKGVGIRGPGPYGASLVTAAPNCLIERLQVKATSSNYSGAPMWPQSGTLKNCISVAAGGNQFATWGSGTAINCAFIVEAGVLAAAGNLFDYDMINCTLVRSSNLSTNGSCNSQYGLCVWQNCAIFNQSSITGNFSGSSYLATDLASIGTFGGSPANCTYNLAYADCFESTTNDFRLKAGSPLIGAGNTDATNAPNDITGTVRGTGTAGDIGAWEYTSAATYGFPFQRAGASFAQMMVR